MIDNTFQSNKYYKTKYNIYDVINILRAVIWYKYDILEF